MSCLRDGTSAVHTARKVASRVTMSSSRVLQQCLRTELGTRTSRSTSGAVHGMAILWITCQVLVFLSVTSSTSPTGRTWLSSSNSSSLQAILGWPVQCSSSSVALTELQTTHGRTIRSSTHLLKAVSTFAADSWQNNTFLHTSSTDGGLDLCRGLYRPWETTGSFDTGDKWITVTVPFSEFTYNADGTSGAVPLAKPEDFATFVIWPWSGGVIGTECTPVFRIDNLRAVPAK